MDREMDSWRDGREDAGGGDGDDDWSKWLQQGEETFHTISAQEEREREYERES